FSVAMGVQYRPTDCTSVRAGYCWNQNPIPDSQAFVNVASPTINTNWASVGASWDVTPDLTLSVTYLHAFENSVQGNFVTPLGAVPGTAIRTALSADSIMFGISVRFGACPECAAAPCGTANMQ